MRQFSLIEDSVALVLTFTLIGKLGAAGTTGVVYVYTTELFPTVFRNAGIGACSFFGRLGAVSAPQIHLLVRHQWKRINVKGRLLNKTNVYRRLNLWTSGYLWLSMEVSAA